jgi:hypothetical protein
MNAAAKIIPFVESANDEISPEETFTGLARAALEEASGVVEDATRILIDRVLADDAFLSLHIERIIQQWALNWVGRIRASQRSKVVRSVEIDGTVFREAARANTARLMDMPLWGGKPIGEATADEIYASADEHDKVARTHTQKAAWEAAVAKVLEKNGHPGDKCRDCLTETTLATLWEEASNV